MTKKHNNRIPIILYYTYHYRRLDKVSTALAVGTGTWLARPLRGQCTWDGGTPWTGITFRLERVTDTHDGQRRLFFCYWSYNYYLKSIYLLPVVRRSKLTHNHARTAIALVAKCAPDADEMRANRRLRSYGSIRIIKSHRWRKNTHVLCGRRERKQRHGTLANDQRRTNTDSALPVSRRRRRSRPTPSWRGSRRRRPQSVAQRQTSLLQKYNNT